jgi:putative DNA primase/helicase
MSGNNGGGNGKGNGGNGDDDDFVTPDGMERLRFASPLRDNAQKALNPLVFMACRPESYPTEVWEVAPIPQRAILEESAVNEQPIEMIATAFLGGAGAFCQHIADVDREGDRAMIGPISLYALLIADSGERKTTIDRNLVTGPIEESLIVLADREKPAMVRMQSAFKDWEREKADLERTLTKLRVANKKGVADQADIADMRKKLADLEEHEPPRPRAPRLIFDDVTPEAMKYSLITGYPTGALMTDEGGMVIGGRAMTEENALNTMALLNVCFEGKSLRIERRAGGHVSAAGRRLSVSIAMQWMVFEEFLHLAGGKARGAGLLSRFLIAAPSSVAHLRRASRAPRSPRVEQDALWSLVRECMLTPLPTTAVDLALSPPQIRLGRGYPTWADYYDWCHADMAPGRPFAEIKDIAARSPELAARIAVVLHILQHGPQYALLQPMAVATVEAAVAIARWHVLEAKRILIDDDHRQTAADAKEILRCLLKRGALSRNEINQFVACRPLRRDAKRRTRAINWLVSQGLVVPLKTPNLVFVPDPRAADLLTAADNLQ